VSSHEVNRQLIPRLPTPELLGVPPAGEAFPEFTPHAPAWGVLVRQKLGLALAAEALLAGFHRSVAGSDGHRAELDASTALLAEIRPDAEWVVHVTVLAPPHETLCPGFPELGTGPYATPA